MEDDKGDGLGMLMRPHSHRTLVAQDKQSVVLQFDGPEQQRVSILLPRYAAEALRDQLAGILGSPPDPGAGKPSKSRAH